PGVWLRLSLGLPHEPHLAGEAGGEGCRDARADLWPHCRDFPPGRGAAARGRGPARRAARGPWLFPDAALSALPPPDPSARRAGAPRVALLAVLGFFATLRLQRFIRGT